ncbi:MAG: adenylate/guanylate cyclase domain-containing protein [Pseudomonadota bacterium]
MSASEARFSVLRQSADPDAVAAIERLVAEAPDAALNRINVLAFAHRHQLDEEPTIAAFLHAARLGLLDLAWNVLCPGCGGVLSSNATLKTVRRDAYSCALCAAGYEPTLDEMVEVVFTVNPRVRPIAAHDPHRLPIWDYMRQIFWGSGIQLPEGEAFDRLLQDIIIDSVELPPGEKAYLSLQLPAQFVIVFDPVTHSAHFLDVQGEPTRERQSLEVVFNNVHAPTGTVAMRPGPLRLTLDNQTAERALPAVYIAGDALHHVLGNRGQFLTAKRLLTNQTFRDIYKAETLDIDQRLKITSLTFLFTDLRASTELYERVGDLVAFDMVRAHFQVLNAVVAAETGAVVKTIGDAVMATFPTPDRAMAAALGMREAMRVLNAQSGREDLVLKIGLHEGPCLAVSLNDRLDYFGQAVNIAARVQGLATSSSIFATEPVVDYPGVAGLLQAAGLTPQAQSHQLRGIANVLTVYEIP